MPVSPPAASSRASAADDSAKNRPPARRRVKQAAAETETGPRIPEVILVGCGAHAHQTYVPALRALQQAGLVNVRALVDPDERSRDECRRHFAKALPVQSLDSAIAPPDSLAIVATPARFHAAHVTAAVKRGWHVLCASPLAPTAHDGALMIAAAARQQCMLAVDLPRRFFPAAQYLRTLCRDHLLGPAIGFRIHEGMTRPVPEPLPPAADRFESPDGVLHELGIATLDLLTWCLGSPSVLNYADDAMGGVEANAFIELSFPENVRGSIHLSRDWPTDSTSTFVFERGIVRWDSTRPSGLTLQIGSAPSALLGELVTPLPASGLRAVGPLLSTPEQATIATIQNIFATLARRETLRTPATEAMHALSIVEECYARRTPLPQPWLPTAEAVQARAYAPPAALRRS